MYSAKVMEHFANPHNVGELPDANGVGEVGNPKCGDIMRMYLKIENNVIVDVKFLTFGCGAAIATSSMATDLIKGKTVDEALKLTNKAVVEALEGLPPIWPGALAVPGLAKVMAEPKASPHRRLTPPSAPMLMVMTGVSGCRSVISAVAASSSNTSARLRGMTASLGRSAPACCMAVIRRTSSSLGGVF